MKKIRTIMLGALSAMALISISCAQEEPAGSKAILPGQNEIELPVEASTQTFTIYADANWEADVTETWLSIDPMSGFGTVEVTITAEENPNTTSREAMIIIKGGNTLAPIEVPVFQKGDKYRNETEKTATEVLGLNVGDLAKLAQSQVVALTKEAFIVTDGSSMLIVKGTSSDLQIGSKVTIRGNVIEMNGLKAVQLDEVTSVVEDAYTPGQPKDITTESAYAPGKVEYVELTALYTSAGTFQLNGVDVATPFLPAVTMGTYANHNVKAVGYYVGTVNGLAAIHVTAIEDLGEAVIEGIIFEDTFDWVQPFVEADIAAGRKQGDSMAENKGYSQKSSYGLEGFAATFAEKGYEALFPESEAIYVVKGNYLKFSKGKNTNGVRLPAMNVGNASSVVLTFDWGVYIGSGGPDQVELEIEIEGNGTIDGAAVTTPKPHTAGDWEWQSETITITGADDNTRITIKPAAFTGVVDTEKTYYRWFLDNVKVVEGEAEPLPAGTVVYSDDFEWFADIAAAENAGDAVGTDNASAKAPNVFTVGSSEQFLASFAEKGYKFLYGTVGSTEFTEGPDPDKGDSRVMYLQTNYLKFGKTSWNGAISLPALSAISGKANVTIEFDWCWQVTGTNKADLMTISVDASAGAFAVTNASTSENVESGQSTVDGESHIEWQHAIVELNGATASTVLTIRPTYADPTIQNSARKQNRWYLDNIKVTTR